MFPGISLFPERASALAADVDNLYYFITAVAAFFAIVVTIFVIYFAAKYRTSDPFAVGARIHGSIPLELAWSIVPFLVSLVIFVWSASVYFDLNRPPDQTLEIYATGKRWMWKFQHLGGQNEINELHVPLGRPVKITFTSEDVLHSMFFPAFRIKADAIPGRYSSLWFSANKLGQFHLFCAEYCGTKHSGMVGSVFVMEPTAYQEWLSGHAEGGTLTSRGERLFGDLACNTCHLSDGSGRGPSLANKFGSSEQIAGGARVAVDEAYLRESILLPQAKVVAGYQPLMPTFQGLLSEENVMALVEYVKSLRASSEADARAGDPATRGATPPENR
jgi:cytochrome c oxidase subunit 2